MTAAAPYMPEGQAEFDLWLRNFSSHLSAEPSRFNITEADARVVKEVYDEWSAAYRPVLCPRTKNKCSVAAKDAARRMAEATIRPCAQFIAQDRELSPADKKVLGLNPRINGRTPIKPPHDGPSLFVMPAGSLLLKLTYQCSGAGVSRRAKPPGVTACHIHYASSATRITNQEELPLKKLVTKSPVYISFHAREANLPCYFAARWGVQTGGVSPWSSIVSFSVPMGG
jgi:hypothetical protein